MENGARNNPVELVDASSGDTLRSWPHGIRADHLLQTMRLLALDHQQLFIRSMVETEPTEPEAEALVLGTDIEEDYLVLDSLTKTVRTSSSTEPIVITPQEYRITRALAKKPNCAIPTTLLAEATGTASVKAINVRTGLLRRKLGPQGKLIHTYRGFGYGGLLEFEANKFFDTWQAK